MPLTVVTRDPADPAFAAWVRRPREDSGLFVVSKGKGGEEIPSLRPLIRTLRMGARLDSWRIRRDRRCLPGEPGRIMTEYHARLEQMVRQYPDQWLWLHNRWKSALSEQNRERWPDADSFEEARKRWQDAL